MNPVLILTRNNLELTKKCVESINNQDIPTVLYVADNGSTDGTQDWLRESYWTGACWLSPDNKGVSRGWNMAMGAIFLRDTHCLVLNNDTVLPPWFYRELLSYDAPFVTGIAVDTMPTELPERCPLTPHPDFSAFLIRWEAWEKIGPFDESMRIYCSDCDYHIRGHRLEVPMMKANVPYFHINSQTLKRADPTERAEIQAQADRDREVFRAKYGCLPGTPEYQKLFEVNHG